MVVVGGCGGSRKRNEEEIAAKKIEREELESSGLWRLNGSFPSEVLLYTRLSHPHHRFSAAAHPRCAPVVVLVLVLRESVKKEEGMGEPIGPSPDNPGRVGRLTLSCTSGSALSGQEGEGASVVGVARP